MGRYIVTWSKEIDADTPLEAAKKGSAELNGILTTFEVDNQEGRVDEFDLLAGTQRTIKDIPSHDHDFVGDEDTCTRYSDCPVTYQQHRAMQKGQTW